MDSTFSNFPALFSRFLSISSQKERFPRSEWIHVRLALVSTVTFFGKPPQILQLALHIGVVIGVGETQRHGPRMILGRDPGDLGSGQARAEVNGAPPLFHCESRATAYYRLARAEFVWARL